MLPLLQARSGGTANSLPHLAAVCSLALRLGKFSAYNKSPLHKSAQQLFSESTAAVSCTEGRVGAMLCTNSHQPQCAAWNSDHSTTPSLKSGLQQLGLLRHKNIITLLTKQQFNSVAHEARKRQWPRMFYPCAGKAHIRHRRSSINKRCQKPTVQPLISHNSAVIINLLLSAGQTAPPSCLATKSCCSAIQKAPASYLSTAAKPTLQRDSDRIAVTADLK